MRGGLTSLLVFLFLFSAITPKPNAKTIPKPNLFHFPITKHEPDNLFYSTLNVGSAGKFPLNLVLHLGTNLTWLNCRKLKSISSRRLRSRWRQRSELCRNFISVCLLPPLAPVTCSSAAVFLFLGHSLLWPALLPPSEVIPSLFSPSDLHWRNPNGGAELSSVLPYTLLHTDIYNALAKSFTQRAKVFLEIKK